jgi:hypothetical protein
VPVLGHDEFRDQRHDTVMSRCHQCRGEQSVVIFGLAVTVLTSGTIVATHIVGAVVLNAVKCDQHMVPQPPERFDATRSLQFIKHIVEHWMKPAGLDRVQLRADLAVSGDFGRAEQRLAVRAPAFLRQMALVFEKRRALHEEDRKRGEPEIRHLVLRIGPDPPVRQQQATAAQRGQKAIQSVHGTYRVRDQAEPPGLVSRSRWNIMDCGRSDSVRPERRRGILPHTPGLASQISIMRTAAYCVATWINSRRWNMLTNCRWTHGRRLAR